MIDRRLQQSFWLSEFLRSDTAVRRGIDNTPPAMALANIENVLAPGMQRVRNSLQAQVVISSGFRCLQLNRAIGSSDTSQHLQGLACDFTAPEFGGPRAITKYLMERSGEIRFDQLIFEGSWVHISFSPAKPRSEVLTAHFSAGGGVSYSRGVA